MDWFSAQLQWWLSLDWLRQEWVWWAAGVIALFLLLSWRFRKAPTTFGSAGWLSLWKAYRRGLFRE